MHKFVVRLLDANGALLAWTTVWAEPRPQAQRASCPFWPTTPTQFTIEQAGVVASLSIHWCELDIARRGQSFEPVAVAPGQVFNFTWMEPVWLVAGMRDVSLPAVTVRDPIVIGVPTGSLVGASAPA